MASEQITEFVNSRGVTLAVDAGVGVIKGVKILGLTSRNGRTYQESAVRQAMALYEGSKVNVNHAKGNPSGPRDYQDRIGQIRGVKFREGEGLFADFHFNPKHAMAEQVAWDAEHAPENVGFSHNIQARLNRRGKQPTVEAITAVQSVDLVADPATTHGLFESEEKQDMDLQGITLPQLKASRSDIVTEITEQAIKTYRESDEATKAAATQKAAVDKLTEDNKTLVAKVDQFEVKEKLAEQAGAIATELKEAKLPESAVTEVFRAQLTAAKDAEARKVLIEDRRDLGKLAGNQRPVSRDQHLAEGESSSVNSGKEFAIAIT